MAVLVLTLRAPLTRSDLPGLCARLGRVLAHSDAEHLVCEIGALRQADAATVDALARLALIAGREGRALHVSGASAELCELAALMGVNDVLGGLTPER